MLVYNYLIYPLETFYRFVYLLLADWLGNHGTAVIALSLFNFLILYPFTKKAQEIQQEESHLQGILQKQIRDIKDSFSGAEQFEKIQRLYDRYSYHPIMAVRSILGLLIQLPFLLAAFYMLSNCIEIQGVSWGIVRDLSMPDSLLYGINLLPFVMTLVSVLYAHLMPAFDNKQKTQTIAVSVLFLILLYSAPSALLMFWTCNILWSLLHCVFAERLRWISDYFSANELAFYIIFALALTVGLLVPLELYIKNASELWFSFKYILKYFLSNTTKCILVLVVLYFICWRKKIRVIYLSLLFGLLLGVFLQSYFLNLNYGLIDGHEIKWEEYKWQGIINTFIWLVCVGESFVIFRRLKFDENKIRKYVKPISFGIISVQCVVLIFSFIKNPLPATVFEGKKAINVLTTKDMFTISSKDNIIVFLLDAFDAKIFEEIMVKDPEIIDKLTGFTFYPDTTSVYGYTDYSLPQILTGKVFYNDRPYAEYFQEAWKDNPYYQKLLQNNFDIGIYTDGSHVYKEAPISNLKNESVVFNNDSMRSFHNLMLFRMMPHFVKKEFYDYDPNDKKRLIGNQNLQVYKADDRKFYLDLKNNLKYRHNKNCFRFYHLVGAHYPFILDRNINPVIEKGAGSQYEQSVGALKIVLEYINQLKRKSLYDDSLFVIMADHGEHNKIGSRPLLCIKYPKDTFSFRVSNDSISFEDFLPILFKSKLSDNQMKAFSKSVRSYYRMDEEKGFIKYQIVGNAKNTDSWIPDNILVNRHNNDHLYKLGEVIDFTMQGNSRKYKDKGWSEREENQGTWTLGSDSELVFEIHNYKKHDLKVVFNANSYLADLTSRKVKISANGIFVTQIVFDNTNSLHSFIIPSTVIESDKLKIHFTIDHPGISIKYEDGRDLGIFMQKMKIDISKSMQ